MADDDHPPSLETRPNATSQISNVKPSYADILNGPNVRLQPQNYAQAQFSPIGPTTSQHMSQLQSEEVTEALPSKPISDYQGKKAVLFSIEDKSNLVAKHKFVLIGKFSHGRPTWVKIKEFFSELKLKGDLNLSIYDNKHLYIECFNQIDFNRIWLKSKWLVDGCVMRILKWEPDFAPSTESPIVPVWIRMEGIPFYMFEKMPLWQIANTVGKPLTIDARNLNRSMLNIARICVEVDLSEPILDSFVVCFEDSSTRVVMESFEVDVHYEYIPLYCNGCSHLGHKQEQCKRNATTQQQNEMAHVLPEKKEKTTKIWTIKSGSESVKGKEMMQHSMAQGSIAEVASKKSDLLEIVEEHGENVSGSDVAKTQQSSLAINCTNNNLVATKITTNAQSNEVNGSSQDTVVPSKELMQISCYEAGNAADLGARISDCTTSESKQIKEAIGIDVPLENEVSAAGSQCQKRAALSDQIEGPAFVEPTTLEVAKSLVVWEGQDVVAASSSTTHELVSPTVTGEVDTGVIQPILMEENQGACSTYDSLGKPQLTDSHSSGLENKSDWQMVTRNKNKRPIKTQARTVVVCENSEEPGLATSTKKAEIQVAVIPNKTEADHVASEAQNAAHLDECSKTIILNPDCEKKLFTYGGLDAIISPLNHQATPFTPSRSQENEGIDDTWQGVKQINKSRSVITRSQAKKLNNTWADKVEEEQLPKLSKKQLKRQICKLGSRLNNMGIQHKMRGQLEAEMDALQEEFSRFR